MARNGPLPSASNTRVPAESASFLQSAVSAATAAFSGSGAAVTIGSSSSASVPSSSNQPSLNFRSPPISATASAICALSQMSTKKARQVSLRSGAFCASSATALSFSLTCCQSVPSSFIQLSLKTRSPPRMSTASAISSSLQTLVKAPTHGPPARISAFLTSSRRSSSWVFRSAQLMSFTVLGSSVSPASAPPSMPTASM